MRNFRISHSGSPEPSLRRNLPALDFHRVDVIAPYACPAERRNGPARELIWKDVMNKQCELCGHSRAAHHDKRCVLCNCVSEARAFVVQESFAFRTTLPSRASINTRKR
jgi:hypothetical protein